MMDKTQKTKNKWIFVVIWSIISIILITAIYAFVWYNFYKDTIYSPYYQRGNWTVVAIYTFLTYVFTVFLHGYKIGVSRIIELVYANCVSIFLVNVFTYVQISLMKFEFFSPAILIAMSCAQVIVMTVFVFCGNRLFYSIFPPKKILVVNNTGETNNLILKMSLLHKKYNIMEIVKYDDIEIQKLIEKINLYDAVLLPQTDKDLQDILLPICYENNKNIYFYPLVTNVMLSSSEQKPMFDTPVFLCKNEGVSGGTLFVKRLMDIVLSIALLVLTSPIMLITALAIKLQDGGPAVFKQERLTKNGAKFDLYKFRSMIVEAEADGVARLAKQNDDRVTSVGKFIRRTRIDELPQLVNILKGDITFVGPRPERAEIAAEYEKSFPEFRYRLKVKAGLTGYSQVVGRYNTTPRDKLLLDLYYIKKCSILFDLEILLMTAKVLILPESTQGVTAVTALNEE